jgi:hypothetical protein
MQSEEEELWGLPHFDEDEDMFDEAIEDFENV